MIESAYIDSLQIHGGTAYGVSEMSLGAPPPREVSDLRPSDHGMTDATRYYGARSIELVGFIQTPTFGELWPAVDELKKSMAIGSLHTFKFRREGLSYDEQAQVRVASTVDIPGGTMPSPFLQWGVSLVCPDPRIYEAIQSSGSYDPTDTGSGGLFFPLTFPLDFQASETSGLLEIVNAGTIETPPVITITGPVTNPIVDNESTGHSIYTQGLELASGNTLVINVAERWAKLNGTTKRPDLIDASLTDWFSLEPGTNQLRLRGSGMSAGSTELSITYRSARI